MNLTNIERGRQVLGFLWIKMIRSIIPWTLNSIRCTYKHHVVSIHTTSSGYSRVCYIWVIEVSVSVAVVNVQTYSIKQPVGPQLHQQEDKCKNAVSVADVKPNCLFSKKYFVSPWGIDHLNKICLGEICNPVTARINANKRASLVLDNDY